MYKMANWVMKHRFVVLGIVFLITAFFGYFAANLQVKSKLEDLLPQSHPYIKINNKYVNQLGTPFKIFMTLKVKSGDIYTPEIMKASRDITEMIDAIPGVDHNQVYSIASRKVKKTTVTADSVFTENLMGITPPATKEQIEEFKDTVRNVGGVYGTWVSRDETALLLSAGFIPERTEIHVLFNTIEKIKQNYANANFKLYVSGEPILNGWIYYFSKKESLFVLGCSVLALVSLLFFYFRNLVGVLVPVISTAVGAVWGVGFCGLVGFNLEPLTLVVPLLISARALSHSVQITERYFECYDELKKVIPACIETIISVFPPGLLGVLADAAGIILIAVAPIPIMQKLAYICCFWSIAIIPTCLYFTPVLMSFFKPPKNIPQIVDLERGFTQKLLGQIAKIGFGKKAWVCSILVAIMFLVSGWYSLKVDIGDVSPGNPILWQNSDYNQSIAETNKSFPGTEELYIIFEGTGSERAIENFNFLKTLETFQRYMEKDPKVGLTLSINDFLPPLGKMVLGGYYKFGVLPPDRISISTLFYQLRANSTPNDFDLYMDRGNNNATVILWLKDHMGNTIREVIARVKQFSKDFPGQLKEANATVQLASGNIGLLAAINETVQSSQLLNFILVISSVFVMCIYVYKSWVAPVILMIPLNLANFLTLCIMNQMGIGLNVNTLPLVAVGVGVGIDYGIYLLSRICEEFQTGSGDYNFATIRKSLKTTGKAIFFTATTMVAGVIFWYFLSSLRFQAEMGLLLALIMFINMLGALLVIPALVYVIKPKFLGRVNMLIKANVANINNGNNTK